MAPTSLVVCLLLGTAGVLLVLAVRAWRTLEEGRGFQAELARLTNDQLHALLSGPRTGGSDILYRLNALMELERRDDPRLVPLYIELLQDPHPSVVSVCLEALRERTGENFRLKENETLPDPEAWARWWRAQAPQS